MESKLYIGNLSYNTTEDDLRTLFSQAGDIKNIALILDRETHRPKGFGFIEMGSAEDAEKAIQMFNEYTMDGRKLTVSMARSRPEGGESPSGQRGGYGRGGPRRRY